MRRQGVKINTCLQLGAGGAGHAGHGPACSLTQLCGLTGIVALVLTFTPFPCHQPHGVSVMPNEVPYTDRAQHRAWHTVGLRTGSGPPPSLTTRKKTSNHNGPREKQLEKKRAGCFCRRGLKPPDSVYPWGKG